MVTFHDGPAKGVLALHRAPVYLRAVVAPDGKTDALDQWEDTAAPTEAIYVYLRIGDAGQVHINGKNIKGFYALAQYRHLADVDGEPLRDFGVWSKWCLERAETHPNEWQAAREPAS